jgi:hypothetical protein
MAHAGPSGSAQPPRTQHSRLERALRRYFALLAALLVVVLVGAGCSVTQPAGAQGRDRDRPRQQPTTTTVDDGQGDGDGEGEEPPAGEEPGQGDGDGQGEEPPAEEPPAEEPPAEEPGQGDGELPFSTTECSRDLPEATGQQTDEIGGPVCNTGIGGAITGPDDIPTVKIARPRNGDEFSLAAMNDPNDPQLIPCRIRFRNFTGGQFDGTGKNGQARQFGLRPFEVAANGNAVGHAHCYLRDDNAGPTDQLQSFLALNDPNQGNTLEGEMPPLADDPASLGTKKFCVDLAGGNHMTWNKGIAQRFPAVDCVTIEIVE